MSSAEFVDCEIWHKWRRSIRRQGRAVPIEQKHLIWERKLRPFFITNLVIQRNLKELREVLRLDWDNTVL